MSQHFSLSSPLPLPVLPLVLCQVPPGLELILAQEGIPTVTIGIEPDRPVTSGRFVVYDPRKVRASRLSRYLTSNHILISTDSLIRDLPGRPWDELTNNQGTEMAWEVAGRRLVECVGRVPKASLRRKILDRLRTKIEQSGGLWVRLANYPAPYRSAFNLRLDLDERVPADYFRFAEARKPIDSCTTHFVSTAAYGNSTAVLDDLRGLDTQSHGHYHFIYRNPASNERNLTRADVILRERAIVPSGFAAPHGRWNPGLDSAIEDLGYEYSSDFQVGYDDLPFFPWRGDRFSKVLQIPIHPVCEGLFTEAGLPHPGLMGEYFADVVERKLAQGEPAFVYGHPERRLGRHPEIVRSIVEAVAGAALTWRVTLTDFALWWIWRGKQRWSLMERGDGRYEVLFDEWDSKYPLAMEIVRGRHSAHVAITRPQTRLQLDAFAYERLSDRPAVAPPSPALVSRNWRGFVRAALDWETVTPVEDLPSDTLRARIKRELRRRRERVA